MPRVVPLAMVPPARAGEYLRLSISGRAVVVNMATEAALEPVQAANPVHPPIVAIASPPRMPDNHV